MAYLNADPVGDGGQFDMAVNIVEVSTTPGVSRGAVQDEPRLTGG